MSDLNYCTLMPENEYLFKKEGYTKKEFESIIKENQTVTAFVEEINKESNELVVRIGEKLCHLPFDEVTIYPLSYSKNLQRTIPVQICTLLHKKIRVKVIYMKDDEIYVSRRKNMEEAAAIIKECSTVYCRVYNMSTKHVFCDIGDGINAILIMREITKTRANTTSEFFHIGSTFSAMILSVDDMNRFKISYKQMFKPYDPKDYVSGDCLACRVHAPVDNNMSGFYVSVTPQVSGILDVTQWMPTLRYGDKVEAIVTKANDKGIKLRFLRKLS